jgi:hypothetical protein
MSYAISFKLPCYFSLLAVELNGPAVSALRRAIAEVKQRWSVIGWVTKNLLYLAPPRFGRHVKPLVPAVFAVVITRQLTLGPRGGLWPVLLVCILICVIHKKGLCPSSGDINRLMMMHLYARERNTYLPGNIWLPVASVYSSLDSTIYAHA